MKGELRSGRDRRAYFLGRDFPIRREEVLARAMPAAKSVSRNAQLGQDGADTLPVARNSRLW